MTLDYFHHLHRSNKLMSLYHIFRSQTGTFAPSTAGWFSYYVNSSGQLLCQPSEGAGGVFSPAASFALTGTREVVSTGLGTFPTVGNVATGLFYGTTGLYQYPTFLGAPNMWVKAWGPNGELLSLPAYTRSS